MQQPPQRQFVRTEPLGHIVVAGGQILATAGARPGPASPERRKEPVPPRAVAVTGTARVGAEGFGEVVRGGAVPFGVRTDVVVGAVVHGSVPSVLLVVGLEGP
ncbi:hypothetical protein C3488_04165 [Streptomyces sp. Ru72]|nr:hypothetical protein C3488_04165 [Streptomyces sp. Ru72]